MNSYIGEIAALSAAFIWAASSTIYGLLGAKISPLQLNLSKGLIAIALIIITLLLRNDILPTFETLAVVWLLISGAVGIGLGDTAYFLALNNLGARRTLLLETLAPPLTGLLAFMLFGESLSPRAWCGILITIIGVGWVISERTTIGVINAKQGKIGIIWAIIGVIAQANGAVLSRLALVESNITPLWSTLIRLIGGILIIIPLLLLKNKPNRVNQSAWSLKLMAVLFITAFGSTYLGIWLQQTALKFTPAAIAQTLLATSPLFVLPMARIMGEKISIRAILGVIVAISGITLLSF